jgi:hypothetical protein
MHLRVARGKNQYTESRGEPSLGETMDANGARNSAGSLAHDDVTEECISERRLWMAVIVMAVEDWCKGTLRARREAQSFLFDDNADFHAVCASAGLNPAALQSRLLKIGQRVQMHGPYLHPVAA